ncbi:MAG: G8 domain-containing protein [Pseudomonadota bacterium]
MAQANQLANPSDATHVAIKSGNWSDPSTWEGGRVPGSEADVYIPESTMVTYDMDSDASLSTVRVDGHLKWSTTTDTSMLVETIVTAHGSKLEIGSEADPIPSDISASVTFRDTPINLSIDPEQLSHGLVAFGEVEIHGAAKESHLTLKGSTDRGDKTIEVDGDLTNWKVGDTVLLVGTGNGSADEERVITAVDGDTLTLDRALSYNHNSVNGFDFDTFVGNLSRNVTFSSENPEGVRGHVMLHNGTPDPADGSINSVSYAAFDDLGRTDAGRLTGTAENPIGRYPLHLHEIGTDSDAATSVIVGNAVNGSPGWGIAQHGSRAIVNDNIVYDTVGSGIISETGNETGEWIGNLVTSVSNNDVRDPSTGQDQVGSEGAAFENQSRVIIQQDNIAANASIGWNFSGREDFEFASTVDGVHRKMFERDQLPFDPSPFDVAIDHEEPPIVDFNDNTVIASGVGLRVFHRQTSDDTDTMSVFRNFDIWGGDSGVRLDNYASNYEFIDSTWQGDDTGFKIARKTSSVVFNDVEIADFGTGYKSHSINHEVVLIDTSFTNVKTEFDQADLMESVTSSSLRNELLDYYESNHGIDYENPIPPQLNSADLTPVNRVTFELAAGADVTIGPNDRTINVIGTITDSVGERRYNEYVEAKTGKGVGGKDANGVSINFGSATRYSQTEFTTEEFIAEHGAYQKADGTWVAPVVHWITERLSGDNHPVIIEINLVGFDEAILKENELNEYPNPSINNKEWYEANSTATSYVDMDHSDMDHGHTDTNDDSSHMDAGPISVPVEIVEQESVEEPVTTRDDRADQNDSNIGIGAIAEGPMQVSSPTTESDGYLKLEGDAGANSLTAGDEATVLIGGDGRDTLRGGDENDILIGGTGRDKLYGGAGADTFVANRDDIDDIFDFSLADGDLLDLSEIADYLQLSEAEMENGLIFTQLGSTLKVELEAGGKIYKLAGLRNMELEAFKEAAPWTFSAEDVANVISSSKVSTPTSTSDTVVEASDDIEEVTAPNESPEPTTAVLEGTKRHDQLEDGDAGTLIKGYAGRDRLYGGAGDDILEGGEEKDYLYGGAGNDTLTGNSGNNWLVRCHIINVRENNLCAVVVNR